MAKRGTPASQQMDRMAEAFERHIQEIMETRVADKIIETGVDAVQREVYDVYQPRVYRRLGERSSTRGLKNEWSSTYRDGKLYVTNTRRDRGKWVAPKVETGEGYNYPKPRRFIQATRVTLRESNVLTYIVIEELMKRGIKVDTNVKVR